MQQLSCRKEVDPLDMVVADKEEKVVKEEVDNQEREKEWVQEMQVVGQVRQGINQEGDVPIILLVIRNQFLKDNNGDQKSQSYPHLKPDESITIIITSENLLFMSFICQKESIVYVIHLPKCLFV